MRPLPGGAFCARGLYLCHATVCSQVDAGDEAAIVRSEERIARAVSNRPVNPASFNRSASLHTRSLSTLLRLRKTSD